MSDSKSNTLFAAGKAKWLLENIDKLSEDERALLLAIAKLEKESGREITPEEQAALDKVAAETGDFDAGEIMDAVSQMMTAETTRHPIDEWPSGIYRMVKRKKKDPKGFQNP